MRLRGQVASSQALEHHSNVCHPKSVFLNHAVDAALIEESTAELAILLSIIRHVAFWCKRPGVVTGNCSFAYDNGLQKG